MLGDPFGRIPMREATRIQIGSDKVTTYLGGPPRTIGEASFRDSCCLLEVCLNSQVPMTAGMKGFVAGAVSLCVFMCV